MKTTTTAYTKKLTDPLAAAEILTAAEQWPQNPAWLTATDRLYGHQ